MLFYLCFDPARQTLHDRDRPPRLRLPSLWMESCGCFISNWFVTFCPRYSLLAPALPPPFTKVWRYYPRFSRVSKVHDPMIKFPYILIGYHLVSTSELQLYLVSHFFQLNVGTKLNKKNEKYLWIVCICDICNAYDSRNI